MRRWAGTAALVAAAAHLVAAPTAGSAQTNVPAEAREEEALPAPDGPTPELLLGVTLVLGGSVLVVAGIFSGIAALVAEGDIDGTCVLGPSGRDCPSGYDLLAARGRYAAARDTAWGLSITGGLVTAAGAILLAVLDAQEAPTVTALCTDDGCSATMALGF